MRVSFNKNITCVTKKVTQIYTKIEKKNLYIYIYCFIYICDFFSLLLICHGYICMYVCIYV